MFNYIIAMNLKSSLVSWDSKIPLEFIVLHICLCHNELSKTTPRVEKDERVNFALLLLCKRFLCKDRHRKC